jgi:hypothetical protein
MMTGMDAASPRLPEIDDERLAVVEAGLFAGIAREREARGRRRRRIWTGVGAAAAVVVVALAIVPAAGLLGFHASSGSAGSVAIAPLPPQGVSGTGANDAEKSVGSGTANSGGSGSTGSGSGAASTQRDVVTTASATVRVDDVRAAATKIGATAKAHGGYVQSMNIGQTGSTPPPVTGQGTDSGTGVGADTGTGTGTIEPSPPVSGAWITVRVPADQLDDVVTSLSGIGTVEASSIDRQDVTDQATVLRAQVAASQASVDRLTQLIGKAASVADLLTAETALTDRQAALESEQQQLKALEDQVAMSTLTVTLLPHEAAKPASTAGFGSGLVAGWNSLVGALNGVVIVVGFLLPWIIVAAIVALIVWGVMVLVRRRRRRPVASPMPPAE